MNENNGSRCSVFAGLLPLCQSHALVVLSVIMCGNCCVVAAAPKEQVGDKDASTLQLAQVRLGTLAAAEERKLHRPDNHSLFAMHGNPTLQLVPTSRGAFTVYSPSNQTLALPAWAAALHFYPDKHHVAWLYNRYAYAMGFEINQQHVIDVISVAGLDGSIQVVSPKGSVSLGDTADAVQRLYGKTHPLRDDAAGAQAIYRLSYDLHENVNSHIEFTIRYNRVVGITVKLRNTTSDNSSSDGAHS